MDGFAAATPIPELAGKRGLAIIGKPPHLTRMNLELTDDETAALDACFPMQSTGTATRLRRASKC